MYQKTVYISSADLAPPPIDNNTHSHLYKIKPTATFNVC